MRHIGFAYRTLEPSRTKETCIRPWESRTGGSEVVTRRFGEVEEPKDSHFRSQIRQNKENKMEKKSWSIATEVGISAPFCVTCFFDFLVNSWGWKKSNPPAYAELTVLACQISSIGPKGGPRWESKLAEWCLVSGLVCLYKCTVCVYIWMYMVAFYEEMGWFLVFWFDSDPTSISFLHQDDTVKNGHDASMKQRLGTLNLMVIPSFLMWVLPFLLCGRGGRGWSKPVAPYKPQRQDKKQLPQAAQKFMLAWQRHARCHDVFENVPVVMRTLFFSEEIYSRTWQFCLCFVSCVFVFFLC